MMKILTLTIAVFAIFYGYHYLKPLSMKNAPWRLRLTLANWRILFKMCVMGEVLGLGAFYENLNSLASPLMRMRMTNVSDVNVTVQQFANVRTVVYQPTKASKALRPGLVYYHGGGWVLGAPEMHQLFFIEAVRQLGVVIAAVDYGKAPTHLFPRAYHDCRNALMYFWENAGKFGVAQNRIAVGGDSAGGNLAASVVGNFDSIKMKFSNLILVYPVLQGLDFQLPSYMKNANEEMLSREMMVRFWNLYLTGNELFHKRMLANDHTSASIRRNAKKYIWNFLPGGKSPETKEGDGDSAAKQILSSATVDSVASPILLSDAALNRLPPLYVITCEYDILRDEAVAFSERVKSLGRPVVRKHYLTYHAILSLFDFGIPEASQVVQDLIDYLKTTM